MALPVPGTSTGQPGLNTGSNLVTVAVSLPLAKTAIITVPKQLIYVLQFLMVNVESGANRVYSVFCNIDGTDRQIASKSIAAAVNDNNIFNIVMVAGSTLSGIVDNADTPIVNCFITYAIYQA